MNFRQIIALILALFQIATPFVADKITDGGRTLMYDWSESLEFTDEYFTVLEKSPERDYKILNISDVQVYDDQIYTDGVGDKCLDLVRRVIEAEKPDLITVSGDTFCSTLATLRMIELIDSYGIPWAPIMGNHDGGNVGEWLFYTAWHLERAEHSLFEYGPKDMGYGNYILNITENGSVIHTLYMMDTHINRYYTVDGNEIYGYDHLWDNQIAWYEWAVRGNEALAGHPIQSTVIYHAPNYEYLTAWLKVSDHKKTADAPLGSLDPKYADIASGHSGEYGGYPEVNNGFFDKVKELGSTKDIIAGHDHMNDYSILYEGVRLSYALHTGIIDDTREDMIGATVYTVNSQGETDIHHIYYSYVDGEWIPR